MLFSLLSPFSVFSVFSPFSLSFALLPEDDRLLPLALLLLLVFLRSLWFETPSTESIALLADCLLPLERTLVDVVDLWDSSIDSDDGIFFRPRKYGLRACGLGAVSLCSDMTDDLEMVFRSAREWGLCVLEWGLWATSFGSLILDDLEPLFRRSVRRCFLSCCSIDSLLFILYIGRGITGSFPFALFIAFILAISAFTMLVELLEPSE